MIGSFGRFSGSMENYFWKIGILKSGYIHQIGGFSIVTLVFGGVPTSILHTNEGKWILETSHFPWLYWRLETSHFPLNHDCGRVSSGCLEMFVFKCNLDWVIKKENTVSSEQRVVSRTVEHDLLQIACCMVFVRSFFSLIPVTTVYVLHENPMVSPQVTFPELHLFKLWENRPIFCV